MLRPSGLVTKYLLEKREELRLFAEATGKEHIGSPKSKHQTMTSDRKTRFSRNLTTDSLSMDGRKKITKQLRVQDFFLDFSKKNFGWERAIFLCYFDVLRFLRHLPGIFYFHRRGLAEDGFGFILRWGGGRRRVFWRRGFCRRACGRVRRCVVLFLGSGLECGCGCF